MRERSCKSFFLISKFVIDATYQELDQSEYNSKKLFDEVSVIMTRIIKVSLTIRPFALKGYGSIAHEAKPNGLLTRGP